MVAYRYNPGKIGTFIENCRNAFGLSQSDVANEIGVTVSTVSKWESGANQPKTEEQILLANLFGVSLVSFMECSSKDITAGDLYFESFLDDLGNIDLSIVSNKKRFVTTYVACKQRLNHLIKQYLIEDHIISFQEFEKLSKAIRFGFEFDGFLSIHKCTDEFNIHNCDLKNVSLKTDKDKEITLDYSNHVIIDGVDYDTYLKIEDKTKDEFLKEGINNVLIPWCFFIEENGKQAFCNDLSYTSSTNNFATTRDLILLKFWIKIGLPLENIHFYCFDLGEQASVLIDNDSNLLESYLSSKNINDFKLAYAFMLSNHKLTAQEEQVIIKVAGEKTIYGDDMII